jgi:uncharacterized protein (DUF305 family)
MKHHLRSLALPTALAATLALTACGSGDMAGMGGMKTSATTPSGAQVGGARNAADVSFATMMIPHHVQAVVMADAALKQATDPKVIGLAPRIKAAQSPEIERMSGWLAGWDEPVPAAGGGSDMAGMSGMGGHGGGMMSAQEMTDLSAAKGSAFDRMWLQMMVRHHEGAIDMAETAFAKGVSPDTRKLARSIIDSQSREIAEMRSILTGIEG